MNAKKQISIEQLFRLYPQLRADNCGCGGSDKGKEERSLSDTRSAHGPEERARETCMEA